jgi:hypothetical protein
MLVLGEVNQWIDNKVRQSESNKKKSWVTFKNLLKSQLLSNLLINRLLSNLTAKRFKSLSKNQWKVTNQKLYKCKNQLRKPDLDRLWIKAKPSASEMSMTLRMKSKMTSWRVAFLNLSQDQLKTPLKKALHNLKVTKSSFKEQECFLAQSKL